MDRDTKEAAVTDVDSCPGTDETCVTPSTSSSSLAVVPYMGHLIADFHERTRTFTFAEKHHVTIQQNWEGGGVAAVVWDAAVVLGEYLVNCTDHVFSHKRVIELGAGTGLAGIVASMIGAHVTVTDRAAALKTLHENIRLNRENCTGSVDVAELVWGENLEQFPEPFDVILGADIIYIEETFDDLLATLNHLSNSQTTVLLSCRIRYARDKRFLRMLRQFFKVEKVLYDSNRDVHLYSAVKVS